MRIVFVGASKLSVTAARGLLDRGHEVVMIERDKQRIDELSEELDCGFLHGDGSRPAVLKEAAPRDTDYLFCLSGEDKDNIIASLVARSLGFSKVVTKIEDQELEHICTELGLEHIIVPTRTISRFLTDMVAGTGVLELSAMIKYEARFFSFIAREEDEGRVSGLKLPESARVICLYRDERFMIADEDTALKKGDEVLVLTHSENMPYLRERWAPKAANDSAGEGAGAG